MQCRQSMTEPCLDVVIFLATQKEQGSLGAAGD